MWYITLTDKTITLQGQKLVPFHLLSPFCVLCIAVYQNKEKMHNLLKTTKDINSQEKFFTSLPSVNLGIFYARMIPQKIIIIILTTIISHEFLIYCNIPSVTILQDPILYIRRNVKTINDLLRTSSEYKFCLPLNQLILFQVIYTVIPQYFCFLIGACIPYIKRFQCICSLSYDLTFSVLEVNYRMISGYTREKYGNGCETMTLYNLKVFI